VYKCERKEDNFCETNRIYCEHLKFKHIAMTTISQQVPERENMAGDEPSVAAISRPRRPEILRVLVPHCCRQLVTSPVYF
jgi:hypothetical protein